MGLFNFFSSKEVTLGQYEAVQYSNTERGLMGVTPSGVTMKILSCKKNEGQVVVEGVVSQLKNEKFVNLDTLMPQPNGANGATGVTNTAGSGGNGMGGMK